MNTYPDKLFAEIEFDHVREQVAGFAVTSHARKKLLNLFPNYSRMSLKVVLNEVNELLALYENYTSIPALSAAEIDELVPRLRVKNSVLEVKDFMVIKDLVNSYNTVYIFFRKQKDFTPIIQKYFDYCQPNQALPDEIDRIFDRKGEVRSDASKELWEIRSNLQKKRAAADRIFYKSVKKYEEAGFLGQIHESVSEDRRVLAINASYKNQVKGIFHGSSAKNSLIFLEPLETIEINNEITLLIDEERREIMRILRHLTAFVAGFLTDILSMAKIMQTIDFINAKARYAYVEKAAMPNLSSKPMIHLIGAINPVLRHFNRQRGKDVVAMEAELNEKQRLLVISGPNAGGKSISLKTIGLLQVMLQSGLLVPVNPRSTFGWFDSIMADIGDSQSIENELSTYSSKLAKMKHIIECADKNSLILIDEFGSGSDPELGSALAQVFLEELTSAGAKGVLTTHYNSIKALAGDLDGVTNASMQFNSQTFTPEYVLNIGTPGSSYTFEVAQRVGIAKRLISTAKAKLDIRTVAIDKLLVAVQSEKNKLTEVRESTQERLKELSALKDKQTGKISQLEEKLEKYRTQNQAQAETLNWGKRIENMATSYLKDPSPKKKKEITARFWQILTERSGIVEAEQKKEEKKENKRKAARLKKLLNMPVAVGDKVKLLQNNQPGQIQDIRKDKYLIVFSGNISTWVGREKFVLQ